MATEKTDEAATGEYTKDGTVDLHGNPVLRWKRGGWKACSFIVVYELFERMAYYGIASNLVLYLTNKLHQGTVTASNNVTNWVGTIWLTPVLGAYIADAYLGRYWTFIIASIIYFLVAGMLAIVDICRALGKRDDRGIRVRRKIRKLVKRKFRKKKKGMCLLTLSVSLPSLKPPSCESVIVGHNCINKASSLQLGVFFTSLYIIAIGTGGTKPNISTIGADQFDDFHPKERAHKLSFFNWWMFSIFFGILFANSILVYIQDNVGWTVGYALPTLGLLISIIIFIVGTPIYRHKLPAGSPFTKMAQVIVAALRKWKVTLPEDMTELQEWSLEEYKENGKFRIDYTPSLSFLSKAAVKTGPSSSPWALCTVTQTEETKQMLRMLPVLFVTFIPSALVSLAGTLFIKQGATLNCHMGPHFSIPPASLGVFTTITMLISIFLYDRFLVPFARRLTGNPRGISLLQRMGIGCAIQVITILIASFTEHHRLSVARAKGVAESGNTVDLTAFVLLPQFLLVGIADAFLDVAKIEFFYDQAPEGMKSLGTSYAMTTIGVGGFINSLLLKTTARVTERDGGRKGWILNNLNKSHLDYYYAFLAVLYALNFAAFIVVSRFYVYKAEFVDDNKAVEANKDNVDLSQEH